MQGYLNGHQLALPIYLQEENTFENFYPGDNKIVLQCLKAFSLGSEVLNYVYLWGYTGVGCSHLLQACCQFAHHQGFKTAYISLDKYTRTHVPAQLQELTASHFVCLDEIDYIAGDRFWEEGLFHLYNELAAAAIPLAVAAHAVPSKLGFKLPDLASRLESGLLFQVQALKDSEKVAALQLRARLRGFELPQAVGQFLLSRLFRHPATLFSVLNRLDDRALAHHRKLTIPFVKEVLSL